MIFPAAPLPASPARLAADWRQLCRRIGPRTAGGKGESRAADYLLERFRAAGLSAVRESFPCRSPIELRATIAAKTGSGWRKAEGLPLVNSASTPGDAAVEGEIVWIEGAGGLKRHKRGSLRGKIALLFGQTPGDTRGYRALVATGAAALLQVDDRLPFAWPVQNALLPEWVGQFGALPTVGIAFTTAWQWRAKGIQRARVAVTARHRRAPSSNVVATLAGESPEEPAILFGAHHDTPPGLIGADDNASGVVCLLELARVLASVPHRRRTFVFASFGTEEQLSVGSAAYVRRHRRELARIGLMVNFDSISSMLGHNHIYHSGQAGLGKFFQARMEQGGHDAELNNTITPFSDHFPFTAFGIPAVWFYRSNMRGGARWQHHSGRNHDSLAAISPGTVAGLIDALAPILLSLSEAKSWPFGKKLSPAVAAKTAEYARKWYGFKVGRDRRARRA